MARRRKMGGACKPGTNFILKMKNGRTRCACVTKNNSTKFLKTIKCERGVPRLTAIAALRKF